MGENSAIEWTDHTWNVWMGCTQVSPGCDHCYAKGWGKRRGLVPEWGPDAPRRLSSDANLKEPYKWNKKLEGTGQRQRVFVNSLSDVFDHEVPKEWRDILWATVEACKNLDFILLTKRIGNAAKMVPPWWMEGDWLDGEWPDNVWLGISVVNQEEADRDIPKLLNLPAPVRFLSMEPLLGPVDLTRIQVVKESPPHGPGVWVDAVAGEVIPNIAAEPDWVQPALDWIIVGGESGGGARPMHPDWVRSIRDQCAEAGLPFLFKQWGEWHPDPKQSGKQGKWVKPQHFSHVWKTGELYLCGKTDMPDGTGSDPGDPMFRVGKKKAGRLLDGVEHNGTPEVSHDGR